MLGLEKMGARAASSRSAAAPQAVMGSSRSLRSARPAPASGAGWRCNPARRAWRGCYRADGRRTGAARRPAVSTGCCGPAARAAGTSASPGVSPKLHSHILWPATARRCQGAAAPAVAAVIHAS